MSQNFEEGLTHTGDAFVEFAYDLLAYTIPELGDEWKKSDFERSCKKVFKESFGDAIILFRSRHKEEFRERSTRFFEMEMENEEDIKFYSRQFCKRTLKRNIPLMELIAYCAFLMDTGLFYIDMGMIDVLFHLLDEAVRVFNKYIEPFFTIVGGWHALYEVAKQYVRFVSFTPGIVSALAAEGLEVSKI